MTFAPYQTVVVSFVAAAPVVFRVLGDPLTGTPAQVLVLEAWLVSPVYAPAPNPPTLTTRYPQVPLARAVGEACVPA